MSVQLPRFGSPRSCEWTITINTLFLCCSAPDVTLIPLDCLLGLLISTFHGFVFVKRQIRRHSREICLHDFSKRRSQAFFKRCSSPDSAYCLWYVCWTEQEIPNQNGQISWVGRSTEHQMLPRSIGSPIGSHLHSAVIIHKWTTIFPRIWVLHTWWTIYYR